MPLKSLTSRARERLPASAPAPDSPRLPRTRISSSSGKGGNGSEPGGRRVSYVGGHAGRWPLPPRGACARAALGAAALALLAAGALLLFAGASRLREDVSGSPRARARAIAAGPRARASAAAAGRRSRPLVPVRARLKQRGPPPAPRAPPRRPPPQADAAVVAALPDAPDACSADLRGRIAWGVATSAYQARRGCWRRRAAAGGHAWRLARGRWRRRLAAGRGGRACRLRRGRALSRAARRAARARAARRRSRARGTQTARRRRSGTRLRTHRARSPAATLGTSPSTTTTSVPPPPPLRVCLREAGRWRRGGAGRPAAGRADARGGRWQRTPPAPRPRPQVRGRHKDDGRARHKALPPIARVDARPARRRARRARVQGGRALLCRPTRRAARGGDHARGHPIPLGPPAEPAGAAACLCVLPLCVVQTARVLGGGTGVTLYHWDPPQSLQARLFAFVCCPKKQRVSWGEGRGSRCTTGTSRRACRRACERARVSQRRRWGGSGRRALPRAPGAPVAQPPASSAPCFQPALPAQRRPPPLPPQDMYGGLLDAQFVEDFAYYADTVFSELGHLVRHWLTVRAVGGVPGRRGRRGEGGGGAL